MDGKGTHGGNRKSSDNVSLEDMDITNKQSSRWQQEAAVLDAQEILRRIERRLGEDLEKRKPAKTGPKPKLSDNVSPNSLADLGITKKQPSRWQAEASVLDAEEMIYARRRLGELFAEIPREERKRTDRLGISGDTQFQDAIADIGVGHATVSRWQQEAINGCSLHPQAP